MAQEHDLIHPSICADGDVVKVEVPGVGILSNPIIERTDITTDLI